MLCISTRYTTATAPSIHRHCNIEIIAILSIPKYVDGALGTNTTDWSYEGIAGNQLGRAIGEYPKGPYYFHMSRAGFEPGT